MTKRLTALLAVLFAILLVFSGCGDNSIFKGDYKKITEEVYDKYAAQLKDEYGNVDFDKGYHLVIDIEQDKLYYKEEKYRDYFKGEYYIRREGDVLLMQGSEATSNGATTKKQNIYYKDGLLYRGDYEQHYNRNGHSDSWASEIVKISYTDERIYKGLDSFSLMYVGGLKYFKYSEGEFYVCKTNEYTKLKAKQTYEYEGQIASYALCGVIDKDGKLIAIEASGGDDVDTVKMSIKFEPWDGKFKFPSSMKKAKDYDYRGPIGSDPGFFNSDLID